MIRTAIIALLVVLSLVYLLVYSIYYHPGSSTNAGSGSESPSTVQSITQGLVNTVQEIATPAGDVSKSVVISKDRPTSDESPPTSIDLGTSGITASDVTSTSTNTNDRTILPGTSLYTDEVIADEIGVEYRYALRDTRGIYYVSLGSSTQDLGVLLQSQGGNTFALTTATKILANQLFGSRIVFLNLPQYINQTVLMVVTVGSERRLIEIPYDIYHESKAYLAEKFI